MYSKQMIEYFNHPGLNSTLLGAFASDPLYAVQKSVAKSYFQAGKAFERIFEDRIMETDRFGEKFFICDDIKIPDSFIDVYKSKDPLESHFKYTKKGEFNKTKASTHEVIFQCLLDRDYFSGEKRYPIPLSEYKAMQLSVDRLLDMSIELFEGEEYLLRDLIKNNRHFFQRQAYWSAYGIKKKALYDLIVLMEHKGHKLAVIFDIKYMASLSSFNNSFKNSQSNYVIQSMHYQESISYQEQFEDYSAYPQVVFLVATKQSPFLVQPFLMEDDSIDMCYESYLDLISRCDKWVKDGRPTTGIKRTLRKKIWRN